MKKIKESTPRAKRKCLVKGCFNTSDQGQFKGPLCLACHDMLRKGEVHHADMTFIGVLSRGYKTYKEKIDEIAKLIPVVK